MIKSEQITIRVSKELKRELAALASAAGAPLAQYIRNILIQETKNAKSGSK